MDLIDDTFEVLYFERVLESKIVDFLMAKMNLHSNVWFIHVGLIDRVIQGKIKKIEISNNEVVV